MTAAQNALAVFRGLELGMLGGKIRSTVRAPGRRI